MTKIAVQHNVKDFDQWKTVFDEHAPTRAEFGGGDAAVYQNAGDGNDVLVVLDWSSEQEFGRFMSESDLKEQMERAGVVSQPKVMPLGQPMEPPAQN